jgi:hypothetical protein
MAIAILVICCTWAGIDWHPFAPAGGGFTVLMPGHATEQKKKIAAPQSMSEMVLFDSPLQKADTHCVAGYTDYGVIEFPAGTEDKRLDNARDGAVLSSRGKLSGEKSLLLDVYPGRELTIAMEGDRTVIMRIYAVKNRLYQVAVVGNSEAVASANATKFLDSFKLAK